MVSLMVHRRDLRTALRLKAGACTARASLLAADHSQSCCLLVRRMPQRPSRGYFPLSSRHGGSHATRGHMCTNGRNGRTAVTGQL